MIVIAIVIIGMTLATEVLQWSYTLAVHSHWMTKHKDELDCSSLSPRMAYVAAIMAGLLSVSVVMWVVWDTILSATPTSPMVCGILSSGLHLSHIHFMALVGRCIGVPHTLWPPLSKMVSKYIVRRHPCTHLKLALRNRRKGDKK